MIVLAAFIIGFIKIYLRFLFLNSLRKLCDDTRGCCFGSEIHVSYQINRWWLSLLFCDESVAPMFLPFHFVQRLIFLLFLFHLPTKIGYVFVVCVSVQDFLHISLVFLIYQTCVLTDMSNMSKF